MYDDFSGVFRHISLADEYFGHEQKSFLILKKNFCVIISPVSSQIHWLLVRSELLCHNICKAAYRIKGIQIKVSRGRTTSGIKNKYTSLSRIKRCLGLCELGVSVRELINP